jgi:hypothetical protein
MRQPKEAPHHMGGIKMSCSLLAYRLKRPVASALTVLAVAVSGALISSHASAATVVIGTTNNSNSLPLGYNIVGTGASARTAVRYQQVYGASAFSALTEPVAITGLSFFAYPDVCYGPGFCFPQSQNISDGTYTFSLSTTSRAVNGLSTTLDNNVGTDNTVFFSGALSGTSTVTGTTPFVYDPTMGNVLLDITISSQTPNGSFFNVSSLANDQMSRMWSVDGISAADETVAARTYGLVTQFDYTAVTPVPEPESYAMLGFGLLTVGIVARRRKLVAARG